MRLNMYLRRLSKWTPPRVVVVGKENSSGWWSLTIRFLLHRIAGWPPFLCTSHQQHLNTKGWYHPERECWAEFLKQFSELLTLSFGKTSPSALLSVPVNAARKITRVKSATNQIPTNTRNWINMFIAERLPQRPFDSVRPTDRLISSKLEQSGHKKTGGGHSALNDEDGESHIIASRATVNCNVCAHIGKAKELARDAPHKHLFGHQPFETEDGWIWLAGDEDEETGVSLTRHKNHHDADNESTQCLQNITQKPPGRIIDRVPTDLRRRGSLKRTQGAL